ncbi:MAG: hypothetical protein Q9227_006317 [Pyrenula ochraceoflavens]
MLLLDLPLDAFRKVLQQAVITLGARLARRLRLVNSVFRHEIDDAIIATLALQNCSSTVPWDDGIVNTDFMAKYMRACISTKERAVRVHGGLLDIIDRTATGLAIDSELRNIRQYEDIILDLCRMTIYASDFRTILTMVRWEAQMQKSNFPNEVESETFHSTAHLLPAAIYLKLSGTVDRLLSDQPDLNNTSRYFWSPLCAAAFTGQAGLVQRLLNQGADPYYGPPYEPPSHKPFEWTHIMEKELWYAPRAAANRNHNTILHMLFEAKPLRTVRDVTRKSFLVAAVRSGHLEAIKTVQLYDPSLLTSPEAKELILHEACTRGHTQIVQSMLADECGVTAAADAFTFASYDNTAPDRNPKNLDPLAVAASFGHFETVRLLLNHGAPLQRLEEPNFTPWTTALGFAAKYGYARVSELLIQCGAAIDAGQVTPLNWAVSYGWEHIVRLLLENGCRPDDAAEGSKSKVWVHVKVAVANGRPSVGWILEDFGISGTE